MTTIEFQPVQAPWATIWIIMAITLAVGVFIGWCISRISVGGISPAGRCIPVVIAAAIAAPLIPMAFHSAQTQASDRLASAVTARYASVANLEDTDLQKTGHQALILLDPQNEAVTCTLTTERADIKTGVWVGKLDCENGADHG